MKGFQKAEQEYESKMTNPYEYTETILDEDHFLDNEIEERILEKQIEDYLWNS